MAPATIDPAVDAYEKAVALYPNSALHRAKLTEACRAVGATLAFRREAQAALELDDVTPHIDKKLPVELRDRLRQSLDRTP